MSRRDFFQLFCMFFLRLINRKCAKEKKHQYLTLYQNWNRNPVYFGLAVSASYIWTCLWESLNLKSGQDLSIPKEIHITRTPIRSTRITRITHLCSVRITIAYSAGNLGKVSITICWFFSVKGGGGHTGHEAEISHNLLNLPMLSIPSRVAKGA